MATSCRFEKETGLTHYTVSIVAWQCHGTNLPVGYYVTTDIPQVGHERNAHALGVSWIYKSDDPSAAQAYARGIIGFYRNHPRLRYTLADGIFDGSRKDAA